VLDLEKKITLSRQDTVGKKINNNVMERTDSTCIVTAVYKDHFNEAYRGSGEDFRKIRLSEEY